MDITRDMVVKRHAKLGARSPAQANLVMRCLRILFNFANNQYLDSQGRPILTDNPVRCLSQTRAWYKIGRRSTVIKVHELPAWFEAVLSIGDEPHWGKRPSTEGSARDFLLLVLLTGLRRMEALTARWDDIDLVGRTLTVRDTKNRGDHTLPLTDYVLELLAARHAKRINGYVFPAADSIGYLATTQRIERRIIQLSGVTFCAHDLRRTFASIADEIGTANYTLKRLLNHRDTSDVTGGYVVLNIERLRAPLQRIEDFILKAGGVRKSAAVASFPEPAIIDTRG